VVEGLTGGLYGDEGIVVLEMFEMVFVRRLIYSRMEVDVYVGAQEA